MKTSLLLTSLLFCFLTAYVPEKEPDSQEPKYYTFSGIAEDKFYTVYWAEKINPSEKYDYWAYVAEGMSYYFNESPHIVKEGGNTAYRKYTKITPPRYGFFLGCHPSSCSQSITVVKNKKVNYIDTLVGLRDFIGTVDNIEEALLYATTYDYYTREEYYKKTNRGYEFIAEKIGIQGITLSPRMKIIITKDSFIKVEPIEIKSTGRK